MNQGAAQKLETFYGQPGGAGQSSLVHVGEVSAGKGQLLVPIAVALASFLVRKYSITPRAERKFTGGMAPSMLRRSIDFMEAHLKGGFRLSEVAREADLSASHFIRSFRECTRKTPYQFLLHWLVERGADPDARRSVTTHRGRAGQRLCRPASHGSDLRPSNENGINYLAPFALG